MRTFLVILTTALLTALGLIYARTSNAFPQFFSLLPIPSYATEQTGTISPTGAACTTPRGESVAHGEVFLSFATETGSIADDGCESRSTVCNNGSWSLEQEPLAFETCVLETPETCEVNGFIFAHGSSQEFFKLDEATETCTSETRTCTDGEVDGDETYTLLSCSSSCPPSTGTGTACPSCPCLEEQPEVQQEVQQPTISVNGTPTTTTNNPTTTPTSVPTIRQITQPTSSTTSLSEPNCPAPFGGVRREPGQQGVGYKQAVAPFGSSCEQVSIVCAYGSIRYGSAGNAGDIALGVSSTCSVSEPVACDTACGTIEHGQQVTTFGQANIPHGNGQVCADIKVVSTCSNGSLSPAGGNACSCQVDPPVGCTAPNGQNVAHGASLTLFQSPQVQATSGDGSSSCVWEWRQCLNGNFVDQGGSPAGFSYQHPACTVVPAN